MYDMAFSIINDQQKLDAHFLRWINIAHRQMTRDLLIPSLNCGDPVDLVAVTGSTQKYYLPYDFNSIIAVIDENGRSLDPIPSMDVSQFGEYNSFGSFACFYEKSSSNVTPLAESGSTPVLIGIPNRSSTVTATGGTPFTAAMAGEYILPVARNTTAGAGNPEDYAYRIATFTSTTVVVLERTFRGVLSNAGDVSDLTTGYFEVRPRNTKIITIWGDPGSSAVISIKYQRVPSKLANDEDIPEDPTMSEAIVYKAIELAGWSYQNGFHAKKAPIAIAEATSQFKTAKDRDKELQHNFLTSNPNNRSYSQIGGIRLGGQDRLGGHGVRY